MHLSLAIAALALHTNGSPGLNDAMRSVESCVEQQLNCVGGSCSPTALERSCNYSGLSPRAEAIVRTETLGLASRVMQSGNPEMCRQELTNQMRSAVFSLESDGPIALSEPYAVTPGRNELSNALERELFWRAQLDERLTGQAGARMQSEEQNTCRLQPFAMVVQLRAQNLAFAERNNVLDLARNGSLSDPAKWAVWFVYHHSDLWQAEQAAAADVFAELAEQDTFSNGLASNLNGRVASHQPLYSDDQLVKSWAGD